jgi:GNAT superfamily N-acetyltransferase
VLVDRVPSVAEYRALRLAVGWNQPDPIAARAALDQSVLGVCVELAGTAVAMARVVGDGALYLFIVDVVVHPDHQGQGVGRRLTQRLMELALATAAPSVGLVAAPEVADFYVGLGFDLTSDRYARWPR